MKCERCQHENPPGAKFCAECGAALARNCARCGTGLPLGAKFCPECAQPVALSPAPETRFTSPAAYTPGQMAEKILSSKGALEGERKQVTVLFADLKGSMELLVDRDPEEARQLLDPVLTRMIDAVHRYDGTVNQVMGDGIMALFGAPLAHEDHALRACYAALAMQAAIRRLIDEGPRAPGVKVRIRVGLTSGEVVVRAIGSDLHMDYTAVGQTTHLAARLEQLAVPGTILLTAETLRLVEGFVDFVALGPTQIKGLAEPVDVFQLVGAGSIKSRLQSAAARGLSPLVGRQAELLTLHAVHDQAAAGRGQIVGVVGEPGVGKSRLYWEFTHSEPLTGWKVLTTGSVSYGKATAYLPLINLLRDYFGLDAHDMGESLRERITARLLAPDEGFRPVIPAILTLLEVPVEDDAWRRLDPAQRRLATLDAVKRLLLRESHERPLLLLVEDLHWIDSETQALLDSLVDSLPTARILLLVSIAFMPQWARYGTVPAGAYLAAGRIAEAAIEVDKGLAIVTERQARGYRGPLLRIQAEILMRQEPLHAGAAEERLREALALATELGMRPEIARCRLGLARLDRRSHDSAAGAEHLAAAVALFRELGATFWALRAEAEASEPS